jgi:hypothetical protein
MNLLPAQADDPEKQGEEGEIDHVARGRELTEAEPVSALHCEEGCRTGDPEDLQQIPEPRDPSCAGTDLGDASASLGLDPQRTRIFFGMACVVGRSPHFAS